jgi:hypothetical protein
MYFSTFVKISNNLLEKLVKIGNVFYNAKQYLTGGASGIYKAREKVIEATVYKVLNDHLLKYNYLSTPSYSLEESTGTYTTSDGTDYAADISILRVGRVRDKIRYKVCYTYTIEEVQYITCIFKDTEFDVSNNCIVSCNNKSDLINKISSFSNAVNY